MANASPHSSYVFGEFRLCPQKRSLQGADGQDIPLRGKVYDLLCYLVERPGELVTKSELLEALWPATFVEENNLTQAVSSLRHALGSDGKDAAYIVTVKGRGYQFVGEVRSESAAADADDATSTGVPVYVIGTAVVALLVIAAWLSMGREGSVPEPGLSVVERFDTARLAPVTDYAGSHSEPTLSPDGRMMAYVSDVTGTPNIWVKNLQRGDPLQLTDEPYPASSPSWSPAGDLILYEQAGPDGPSIYSVGTLGSPAPAMVVSWAQAPACAGRANRFVFSRGNELWVADNDGRDKEKIIGVPVSQGFAARQPALSPDGEQVAFIHADEGPLGNLWVIPSVGGDARQLTWHEKDGGIASAPEWSSDGNYIVFSIEADTGGGDLWRIDVNSGEIAALTTGAGGPTDADVSSDGSRVAYTATRRLWKLTRVDPLTGEHSAFYSSRSPILLPVVSADGRRILYFTRNASGMHIVTLHSDGSNLRQLTFDEGGENALPTWDGDDRSVLYYRGHSLHRLNPATGADTEVFADFHWSSRNWLDVHRDRMSYHIVDRPTHVRKSVVRQFGESSETELPVPIEAGQWSADGTELLGWFRRAGGLLICDPDDATCRPVQADGSDVAGHRPVWSRDSRQIYYLGFTEADVCCSLWRVDRDGRNHRQVADLVGFDTANSQYGIDENGFIVYNHLDRSDDEIWMAELR